MSYFCWLCGDRRRHLRWLVVGLLLLSVAGRPSRGQEAGEGATDGQASTRLDTPDRWWRRARESAAEATDAISRTRLLRQVTEAQVNAGDSKAALATIARAKAVARAGVRAMSWATVGSAGLLARAIGSGDSLFVAARPAPAGECTA